MRTTNFVMSRKESETIIVGHDVEITIIKVMGNRVKIGVRAPEAVAVNRGEIEARIYGENRGAA